jgi:hypothetical protein
MPEKKDQNQINIRRSQAVRDFGVGAIVDVPGTSVMPLAIDAVRYAWGGDKIISVNDLRLQELFNVDYFGLAPEKKDGDKNGHSVRTEYFPNAHVCPNCNKIQFVHDLEKKHASYKELVKKEHRGAWFCVDCKNKKEGKPPTLVPSRFVIATEYGLIDDFPYDWYCHSDHRQNRGRCQHEGAGNENLLLISEGSSLGDIYVKCTRCKAKKSLGPIFSSDEANVLRDAGNYLKSRGGKLAAPWKKRKFYNDRLNEFEDESVFCPPDLREKIINSTEPLQPNEKKYFPRVLQRGAGNVYFPVTYTGVCLPTDSYRPANLGPIQSKLDRYFSSLSRVASRGLLDNVVKNELENLDVNNSIKKIEFLIKWYDNQDVNMDLKLDNITIDNLNMWISQFEQSMGNSNDQRKVEYNCFKNRNINVESGEWYKTEFIQEGDLYELLDFIDEIVLMHKIKFLQIQRGFTRVRPLAFEDLALAKADTDVDKGFKDEYNRIVDVRIHPEDWVDKNGQPKERTNWLPAAEIKGEGIFIRFKREVINAWVKDNAEFVNSRSSTISENNWNGMKSFNPSLTDLEKDKMEKSPTFILIHTLSHLLINEISKESGYNAASISEIIYEGDGMEGLLIYTTTSDTEGSLGGLVSMGYPERLQIVFREALEKARWCSSDPICIESSGQGFLGTNLASCYSCSMLPETSCQYINRFLDRGLLIGTIEEPDSGFFNHIGFFK